MDELKDRLRSERTRAGFYQQALADKLKVSKQTVSHWETGQRTPDALTVKELADLFNVTTDYLLCRTDNPAEIKQSSNVEELRPELKALLENAKDLSVEAINNINNIINNLKGNYKLITKQNDDTDIKIIVNENKKPEGLTSLEESEMFTLTKRLKEIRKNK